MNDKVIIQLDLPMAYLLFNLMHSSVSPDIDGRDILLKAIDEAIDNARK